MTTTINADNVTGGAIITGDTSGILALQSAGSTLVTLSGGTVALSAGLTADSASFTGGIAGASATITNAITADSATITSGLTAAGLTYPTSDGTDGQAILTDGSGNLTFGAAGISTGKAIAMAIVFG